MRRGIGELLLDRGVRGGRARRPAGRPARTRPAAARRPARTALTSPISSAADALTGSASIASAVARACPISRGSVQDAPVSSASPTLANASRNFALSAAIRKSQAKRQRRAGAGGDAVDRGDDRLGHRRQRQARSGCSAARPCSAGPGRRWPEQLAVLAQVLADAEAAAGAGEHHRAGRSGRRRPAATPPAALSLSSTVKRVQCVGPVERDRRDALARADQYGVGHADLPGRRRRWSVPPAPTVRPAARPGFLPRVRSGTMIGATQLGRALPRSASVQVRDRRGPGRTRWRRHEWRP